MYLVGGGLNLTVNFPQLRCQGLENPVPNFTGWHHGRSPARSRKPYSIDEESPRIPYKMGVKPFPRITNGWIGHRQLDTTIAMFLSLNTRIMLASMTFQFVLLP